MAVHWSKDFDPSLVAARKAILLDLKAAMREGLARGRMPSPAQINHERAYCFR
jgi:hypothetical protein